MQNITATLEYKIIEGEKGCDLAVSARFMNERYETLIKNCASRERLIDKIGKIIKSDSDSEYLTYVIEE